MTMTEAKEFIIARTFDAPRALVWKAWTSAEANERAMYESATASMQQGFGGTFDKLDDYLKR